VIARDTQERHLQCANQNVIFIPHFVHSICVIVIALDIVADTEYKRRPEEVHFTDNMAENAFLLFAGPVAHHGKMKIIGIIINTAYQSGIRKTKRDKNSQNKNRKETRISELHKNSLNIEELQNCYYPFIRTEFYQKRRKYEDYILKIQDKI
jgi:hypothetical protein